MYTHAHGEATGRAVACVEASASQAYGLIMPSSGAGGIRSRASFEPIEREVTSSRRRLIDERSRHTVRFFGGEFPASDVASFLAHDTGALVVASKKHSELIMRELQALGMNVDEAIASGELVMTSAEDVCEAIIRDGAPTKERFEELVVKRVDALIARCETATVYGEVVDLLAQRERTPDAIALEKLWNELLSDRVRLLCGYGFASFGSADPAAICKLHDHLEMDDVRRR